MTTKQREDRRLRPRRRGWLALMPLVLLALLMAVMGILMNDFSSVPMTIVFLFTGIASLLTFVVTVLMSVCVPFRMVPAAATFC